MLTKKGFIWLTSSGKLWACVPAQRSRDPQANRDRGRASHTAACSPRGFGLGVAELYSHDAEPKIASLSSWEKRGTKLIDSDVAPCEHSWTAYRPTDATCGATGAKHHRALLEVNTTPVLIIISFVFIVTQRIFITPFNASGPYQLHGNWVLSVKLCKVNFDTLSLECLFCSSVSSEWNVLILVIFFRENSSPSPCCYSSSCNTAECVTSRLYLILWFLLNKSKVIFKDPLLCPAIIKRSVSVHLSKNMTDANFLVLKPCVTH